MVTELQMPNAPLDDLVALFNETATELERTEFPNPRNPSQCERFFRARHTRNYDKLLAAVAPLVEAFASAIPEDRASLAGRLTESAAWILTTFACYMPVLGVRRQSPELIRQALIVLALKGDGDVREQLFALAALHHAATKLGIDTPALFGEVAALAPSAEIQDTIRSFPSRTNEDGSLAAFWLRETLTDGEFDIVPAPPSFRRESPSP